MIIWNMIRFLSGKKQSVIQNMETKMEKLAREEKFEKAQKIKEDLEKLVYITSQFRFPEEYISEPKLLEKARKQGLGELRSLLNLRKIPRRIEAYDISNLQGKLATGALVVAIQGRMDNSQYRRFRIKFKHNPDDPEMIREVLRRRLGHPDWPSPDLILIDGGKGQVSAAQDVLEEYNLKIPLMGLAKRLEEVVTADLKVKRLPQDSEALKLLQRIRDESHRFALAYHRKLRAKEIQS